MPSATELRVEVQALVLAALPSSRHREVLNTIETTAIELPAHEYFIALTHVSAASGASGLQVAMDHLAA